jgi:hypothetical protein
MIELIRGLKSLNLFAAGKLRPTVATIQTGG